MNRSISTEAAMFHHASRRVLDGSVSEWVAWESTADHSQIADRFTAPAGKCVASSWLADRSGTSHK